MGNSDIKADVAKEVLYLAKDLLRLHVTLAKDVQNDIYLILFKHQVNIFSPRYDFLNKKEWLFVYKLELNLLELLEIITKDENNRIFEMLQADDDNIYIAVLSLKQFGKLREEKLESPWYVDHVKDNYLKIATPELMMFKMKHKL
jgi:hypothetical protein